MRQTRPILDRGVPQRDPPIPCRGDPNLKPTTTINLGRAVGDDVGRQRATAHSSGSQLYLEGSSSELAPAAVESTHFCREPTGKRTSRPRAVSGSNSPLLRSSICPFPA